MLVGRVGIFIGQAETHKHAGNLKCVVHLRDEWDRAAFADEDSFFAEAGFESVKSFLEDGVRVGRSPRLSGAEQIEPAPYRFGKELADVALHETRDFFGILVGNEARGKLGVSLGGDDGLGALAGVATPNSIEFQGGTRPEALDDRESLFAAQGGGRRLFS